MVYSQQPTCCGIRDAVSHAEALIGLRSCHIFQTLSVGDMTEPQDSQTYASVASRESISVGLFHAALTGLDILSAINAGSYLNAPCQEKVSACCRLEFSPENGG